MRLNISGKDGERLITGFVRINPSSTLSSMTAYQRTRLLDGGRRHWWVQLSLQEWLGLWKSQSLQDVMVAYAIVIMKTFVMTGEWIIQEEIHAFLILFSLQNWCCRWNGWMPRLLRALQMGCKMHRFCWRRKIISSSYHSVEWLSKLICKIFCHYLPSLNKYCKPNSIFESSKVDNITTLNYLQFVQDSSS